MMPKTLLEKAKEKTIIFDGAMGTLIMAAGLESIKSPMLLNLEKPELVTDIHKQYFTAGADVVLTNTFSGNPLKLEAEGIEARMEVLNREAAKLAKQACPEGKFVAGDIGPSGKTLPPIGDSSPEEMQEAFYLQAQVLLEGGVDLILIETMYSLEEALAAVQAVRKASDILLIASMTYNLTEMGYFTIMGETVDQCVSALTAAGADIIGANCTLGSSEMIELTKELRAATDKPVLIQPNAGKPVADGDRTYYEQTPAEFAQDLKAIKEAGADMVGGCCGTNPEFIETMTAAISGESTAD
ncbi:MAG: homocysteine S-methyltransferase family protein [Desulfobacterales bacterium]|jgi:5-methyltetrahydrofolate--homocysteine methyltransferase